jgi:hypothetical protein
MLISKVYQFEPGDCLITISNDGTYVEHIHEYE